MIEYGSAVRIVLVYQHRKVHAKMNGPLLQAQVYDRLHLCKGNIKFKVHVCLSRSR